MVGYFRAYSTLKCLVLGFFLGCAGVFCILAPVPLIGGEWFMPLISAGLAFLLVYWIFTFSLAGVLRKHYASAFYFGPPKIFLRTALWVMYFSAALGIYGLQSMGDDFSKVKLMVIVNTLISILAVFQAAKRAKYKAAKQY